LKCLICGKELILLHSGGIRINHDLITLKPHFHFLPKMNPDFYKFVPIEELEKARERAQIKEDRDSLNNFFHRKPQS